MRLSEILEEPEYYQSEDDIDQSSLREIYDGIAFIASKYRSTNLGAALFNNLPFEDKLTYFNEKIIPLYRKHNLPIRGKRPYGDFQDDVRKMWSDIEKDDTLDYFDNNVVKSVLGI